MKKLSLLMAVYMIFAALPLPATADALTAEPVDAFVEEAFDGETGAEGLTVESEDEDGLLPAWKEDGLVAAPSVQEADAQLGEDPEDPAATPEPEEPEAPQEGAPTLKAEEITLGVGETFALEGMPPEGA